MHTLAQLQHEAVDVLIQLIATPSFSREEENAMQIIKNYLESKDIPTYTKLNNVWAIHEVNKNLPYILLDSHTDTVKPNAKWTSDPFTPLLENGKLTGLGSNDAGGPLVSMMATFVYLSQFNDLHYNLVFAATAEEEISGFNGIEQIMTEIPHIDFAIIGEPTQMQMAIAEKGLMVLDCTAHGRAGHAARNEGDNAIYKAITDINWFQNYQFEHVSDLLGPVKMTVTQIEAGSQHNVVPHQCKYVVDVRTTEHYSNEQAYHVIQQHVSSEVVARSFRLNSSRFPLTHPLVARGTELGLTYYGSPTTSDQGVISPASLKMGPGDSARSHTADEYIFVEEVHEGIHIFTELLRHLQFTKEDCLFN